MAQIVISPRPILQFGCRKDHEIRVGKLQLAIEVPETRSSIRPSQVLSGSGQISQLEDVKSKADPRELAMERRLQAAEAAE